jgi:NAD(P)-dependent dehydrogenase (short-subunit alcohol dehydrogenase family)
MPRLEGRIALVTGAGSGIGRAIAVLFAAEGAHVYVTDVDGATAEAAAGEIVRAGSSAQSVTADVSRGQDVTAMFRVVEAAYGRLDVLVNNAGIIAYEALDELELADWHQVIAVNQTGVFLGMKAVVPSMLANGAGSIVNVSSIWGNAAVAGAHAYHATKGAVRNMSKNAAITYAERGIRVNSLHPGFIATPLTDAQDAAVNEWVVGQTPMRRAGRPEEIAAAALFLASDESSFVTGSELVVDGGYLAQ